MSVTSYSLKAEGSKKLAANFTVREFRCNDGSDKILINNELVELLQKIRTHFSRPVLINSGYRTYSYNAEIGGASGSYHCRGMAADIRISGVDPVKVALFAEGVLGSGGIGCYAYKDGGFVHVDVRDYKSRWVQDKDSGSYDVVENIMPTIRKGSKGRGVKILQRKLGGLTIDGIAGEKTANAIERFQMKNGLDADGICGPKTWAKIAE